MIKKYYLLTLSFCFIVESRATANLDEEYRYLDQLALAAGTDKASNYHNYTEIYAKYFGPLKNQSIKFLEIGILRGNSVKLWESYFKNAELHFIDITLDAVEYKPQRAQYHIANQESPEDLDLFVNKAGGQFDIIIDDGGHTMKQQIVSFESLFPYLKNGGMYIIEDLHTSYWENYGGGKHPGTAVEFLKKLIDEVNFVGATSRRASHRNIDAPVLKGASIYSTQIESIHYYDSVAIIIKR